MPRLVAASILGALLLVGCRTAMPPDPARLAAIEGELGSLILVGFHGTDAEGNADLEDLLCETRVGGILLFARNIVDAEQLARLIDAITTRSAACTARKLFVAVDAEGGNVMRLGPGAGWAATLSAAELGERNDLTLTELEGRRIGAMLRAAGINWNLAPVVDVGHNVKNPVIVGNARSFGADPLLVTEHARAFILGLHAEGVLAALKHFPGHGSSVDDSHLGFTDVTETAELAIELAPYRELIREGLADSVMSAHVFNRRLDGKRPATLSRATITGLLRGELGFGGPVVSDDLRMGAIEKQYGMGEAAVMALDAGVDMLLITDDRFPDGRSAAQAALDAVRAALIRGTLDPGRVEAALERVRAFRGHLN